MSLEPLPRPTAWLAVARSVGKYMTMLGRRAIHQPRENVGRAIRFSDGTTGQVYRETIADVQPTDPCVLVVSFRLRAVRGRGHAVFRPISIVNTPLFVGFPGFVSKFWLAHDSHGVYRGLYEWDGPDRAERYARSLWRALELVSAPGSIDYRVLPGLRRDAMLADPGLLTARLPTDDAAWWRVTSAA